MLACVACAQQGSTRGESAGLHHLEPIPFLRSQVLTISPSAENLREPWRKSLAEELEARGFNHRSGSVDLPDRLNWDIDGDGVPNLADQYPYDVTRSGEDSDGDGLPDFIDFKVGDERNSWLQKEFLKRWNIYVINDGAAFTERELEAIYGALSRGVLSRVGSFPFVSTLIKRKGKAAASHLLGEYDRFWRVITVYEGTEEDTHVTFLHELFHALSVQYPHAYEAFYRQAGWEVFQTPGSVIFRFRNSLTVSEYEIGNEMEKIVHLITGADFPTAYSKLGPAEMFAECGALAVLLLDEKSPYVSDLFRSSGSFAWFSDFFTKIGKTEISP